VNKPDVRIAVVFIVLSHAVGCLGLLAGVVEAHAQSRQCLNLPILGTVLKKLHTVLQPQALAYNSHGSESTPSDFRHGAKVGVPLHVVLQAANSIPLRKGLSG
jgi:hypothetical protein